MKIRKVLASLTLVCVTINANAVPFEFTWQDTITSVLEPVPGISNGDVVTAIIVADNGGSDLLAQSWFQSDVISATVTVGASYVATFSPPYFVNELFRTDSVGDITIARWLSGNGGPGDVDNAGGTSAPTFSSNAMRTSVDNSFLRFSLTTGGPINPASWSVQPARVPEQPAGVPVPGTIVLFGLGLAGLGLRRRKVA